MILNNLNNTEETSSTPYVLSNKFNVSKLIKTVEYDYEIELDGTPGNWPVVVIPRSGSFTATSRNREIETTIIFCPNTGICGENNPDVLPYNIDYSCGFKNKDLLFTNLRLKVNEKNTNDYIYSDTKHIECVNCLVSPEVSFSGNTLLDSTTQNITNISTSLSGVVPGQQYFWSFNNQASNWPTTISPSSGSFISSKDTYNIDCIISFCKDVSCSGLPGYIDYTKDEGSSSYKYLNLNFILDSDNHCYFNDANYGLMVTCTDCISRPTILFDNNKLSLENNCADIDILLSGLEPYQGYDYYFSSHSANWPITVSPISGSFITSKNTSLKMPFKIAFCGSETLCSGDPNLIDYNINYNQLYSDTSCSKYAYVQYNLLKTPNFTVQNDNSILPANPVVQSDIISISCEDCFGSQVPKVNSKIDISVSPNVSGPSPSVPTGTGTLL
jgi:hypothetical protein